MMLDRYHIITACLVSCFLIMCSCSSSEREKAEDVFDRIMEVAEETLSKEQDK